VLELQEIFCPTVPAAYGASSSHLQILRAEKSNAVQRRTQQLSQRNIIAAQINLAYPLSHRIPAGRQIQLVENWVEEIVFGNVTHGHLHERFIARHTATVQVFPCPQTDTEHVGIRERGS